MLKQNLKVSQGHEMKKRSSTKQVLSCVVIAVSLFFTQGAIQAQGVYKWTDAAGKVHYGDRQSAPQKSVKVAETPVQVENKSSKKEEVADSSKERTGENAPPEVQAFRGIPVDRMKKCTTFANEVALIESKPDDDKTKNHMWEQVEKIRTYCPGTGFDCTVDSAAPSNNRCTPFLWTGTKEMIRGTFNGGTFTLKPRKY